MERPVVSNHRLMDRLIECYGLDCKEYAVVVVDIEMNGEEQRLPLCAACFKELAGETAGEVTK